MLFRRLTGLLSLTIVLFGIILVSTVYQDSTQSLRTASTKCGDTAWALKKDSPFFDIIEVNLNDPKIKDIKVNADGDSFQSYSCNRTSAERIASFEKILTMAFYVFLMPLWLLLILFAAIFWWLYGEFKIFNGRRR